jgi:hypothetical protein
VAAAAAVAPVSNMPSICSSPHSNHTAKQNELNQR